MRLSYIDNLRVACMLLGLFVHSLTLGDFGALEYLADFSNMFRMATFYVVSGFFAAMLHQRYGTKLFLKNRLRALVIPLVTALLLLNPFTLWLVFRYHNAAAHPNAGLAEVWLALTGQIPFQGPVIWHLHLWFLFSLIVYVLITSAILPVMQRVGILLEDWRLARWRSGYFLPLILGLGVMIMVLGLLTILKLAGPAFSDQWLLRATALYLPFFLMGLLFYLNDRIWKAVHRFDIPLLVLIIAVALLGQMAKNSDLVASMLGQAQTALWRVWITFSLLALFRRLADFSSPSSRLMSRSIYTIYLFHYLIIYLLATAWTQMAEIGQIGVLIIVALTGLIGTLLHVFVIEKISLLALLFNGKSRLQSQPKPPK